MSLRTFCPCPHLCPTQHEGQCMSPSYCRKIPYQNFSWYKL
jgi:hypothetical protein